MEELSKCNRRKVRDTSSNLSGSNQQEEAVFLVQRLTVHVEYHKDPTQLYQGKRQRTCQVLSYSVITLHESLHQVEQDLFLHRIDRICWEISVCHY